MVTTYLKNKILNHIFQRETYSAPEKLYIALSSTTPTESGLNFTEVSATSYKRVEIPSNNNYWIISTGGYIENVQEMSFNEATEDWCSVDNPITYWGIFDAITGGNLLFYGKMNKEKYIVMETTLVIPVAGIKTNIVNTI